MSSSIKAILIIGGTSGIGEAFAKRFHSEGKHVIVTGRREARLNEMKSLLPGLETYVMDNTDLSAIPDHVQSLLSEYPDINAVWVNGGVQCVADFKDFSTTADSTMMGEIATNFTAPVLFARHFMPHLLSIEGPTTFMCTSSGLAFVPRGQYPIYCATKAAIHSFLVGLRQQLTDTNVNVIEIVPPRVATELHLDHQEVADRTAPAMPLQDYTDKTFEILDNTDGRDLKEVAVGLAAMGANAWRGSIGKILDTTIGG